MGPDGEHLSSELQSLVPEERLALTALAVVGGADVSVDALGEIAGVADELDWTVPRDLMLKQVWGHDHLDGMRTIDVHVRWLRKKIEANPAQPHYIHTVRGVGYRFTDA